MSEAESPIPSSSVGEQWLEKATEDLKVAGLIATSAVGALWAACFHAQQAAEKSLKAVLVARGIDFPRTHSLERLLDLLGAEASNFERSTLVELTPWAVAGRYPEDIPDPSKELAHQLIAGARSTVDAAQRCVSDRGSAGQVGDDRD